MKKHKQEKKIQMGDVWKFESPDEDNVSDELNDVCNEARNGNIEAQQFLSDLWDESWDSIKGKLATEGSVWYVWWMDGIHRYMENEVREERKGGL